MHWLTLHMYHLKVSGAPGYHNALSLESLYLHICLKVLCWYGVTSVLSHMCWKYLYMHISDKQINTLNINGFCYFINKKHLSHV